MGTIVDYASLTTAIGVFAHRTDLAAAGYTDYLIQSAQQQIEFDIPDLNFGNYIRYQENAYPPVAISATGTCPVPSDWLGPKVLTVTTGSYTADLVFKAAAWIYDNYPNRAPWGFPAYVARDVITGSTWPTAPSFLTFTATANQTSFSLSSAPAGVALLFATLDGAMLTPGTDYNVVGSNLVLTNGALVGQTLLVQYASGGPGSLSASGSSSLIFGPYPDSSYTVAGTYYQSAPLLSATQTTNWMVVNAPTLLLAACMVEYGKFIPDDGDSIITRWEKQYRQRLQSLVDADKAERWAASTMQVETG